MVSVNRIKELSKEKGIKLGFLTEQLGITRTYFSDVERGKTKISDDRLAIIADILGTTPAYLKGETDKKEKPTGNGELSEKEKELLKRFNALPEDKQDAMLRLLFPND